MYPVWPQQAALSLPDDESPDKVPPDSRTSLLAEMEAAVARARLVSVMGNEVAVAVTAWIIALACRADVQRHCEVPVLSFVLSFIFGLVRLVRVFVSQQQGQPRLWTHADLAQIAGATL